MTKIINYMATCDITSTSISGSCSGSSGSFGHMYFSGELDKNLIKNINKELIKKICNQVVYIYQIDTDKTKVNIYGESEEKIFKTPIQTWGRILYNDPQQNLNQFSYDTKYYLNIDFYLPLLNEQDIKLREGDIIRMGMNEIQNNETIFFEITNLIYTQPLFGQSDELLNVKAICTIARKSYINALSRIQII